MQRAAIVFVLAVAGGCGGGPGSVASAPAPAAPAVASSAAASAAPTVRPAATIRLSGSTASGVAEASGWLWVTHFEASVLSQVDPRTGTEVGLVEVGPNAGSLTAVGPRLWVAQYTTRPQDARLVHVDSLTASVRGRLQPPNLCCEIAAAAGRIWAVDPRGALLAIDPDGVGVVSSTPIAIDPAVHIGLFGDERALWVSSDTTPLLRVDPQSARVVASVDVGGGIPMALAQDLVWGASPHHVWAVDPASNEVRVRLPLENTIEVLSLAVTQDALWVGARRPGYVGVVLRYDLRSGRLTGEAAVGLPARVLYAFGRIWVVDWDTNTLLGFDAVSGIG
jgi:hypothetical protein